MGSSDAESLARTVDLLPDEPDVKRQRRINPLRALPVMAAALVAAMAFAPVAAAQEQLSLAAGTAAPPSGDRGGDASLTHSAAKATTFKIATVLTNMAIFSLGTGSPVGGAVLTAFNVAKSWGLFTANDYLWDTWFPSD